jgi:NAD(P)-dependent dehydrogenase (short-subunit alcohol dehydrogenase family)
MSTAKTALIIGASRGLGLGLVKTLLADGWQVTATVRNPQKAEALQAWARCGSRNSTWTISKR